MHTKLLVAAAFGLCGAGARPSTGNLGAAAPAPGGVSNGVNSGQAPGHQHAGGGGSLAATPPKGGDANIAGPPDADAASRSQFSGTEKKKTSPKKMSGSGPTVQGNPSAPSSSKSGAKNKAASGLGSKGSSGSPSSSASGSPGAGSSASSKESGSSSESSGDDDEGDFKNYLNVTNDWRTKLNLKPYELDTSLEEGALKGSQESERRGELFHTAFDLDGTQVMAEWVDTYERVMLSWLCEKPELQGLGRDTCREKVNVEQVGDGSVKGHAEAMASKEYTKVGCAKVSKYVTCNLK